MGPKASLISFLVLVCVATCSSKWISTDPCKDVNCSGNGACFSKCNAYKCICEPGFKGDFCEKKLCTPNPCLNGGKCRVKKGVEECKCLEGSKQVIIWENTAGTSGGWQFFGWRNQNFAHKKVEFSFYIKFFKTCPSKSRHFGIGFYNYGNNFNDFMDSCVPDKWMYVSKTVTLGSGGDFHQVILVFDSVNQKQKVAVADAKLVVQNIGTFYAIKPDGQVDPTLVVMGRLGGPDPSPVFPKHVGPGKMTLEMMEVEIADFHGHRCERQCKIVEKPDLPEPLDAMFLVDGSWSVNEGHKDDAVTPFQMALRFVAKFVKQMSIDEAKNRVGFMQFSGKSTLGKGFKVNRNRTVVDPDTRITFEQSVELGKQKLIEKIQSSKFYGGPTQTGSALKQVLAEMKEDARLEDNVMKYLFVMTDGRTWEQVTPPSKALKALGFHIFAIGIGPDIEKTQLLEIANGEADHVFMIHDYKQLDEAFFKMIVHRQCKLE